MSVMDASPKGFKSPGDLTIESILLVDQFGGIADISYLIAELNIYQNISLHYLHCEIAFNDSFGLVSALPGNPNKGIVGGFTGTEMILMSYKNTTMSETNHDETRTHLFRVHSLNSRIPVKQSKEMYILDGISEESYHTTTNKISKAYGRSGGTEISKMIESIYNEYFNNEIVNGVYRAVHQGSSYLIEKSFDSDITAGKHQLIIPNLSVDDTIEFMANEADSDSHIPHFMFYEDGTGFKFKDLSTLVKQEPIEKYSWLMQSNAAVSTKNKGDINYDDAFKITAYKVVNQMDILENCWEGLYKSKTIHLDMINKKTDETVYDYAESNKKFTKLQDLKIPGGVTKGDPIITLMTTRTGHDQNKLLAPENHIPKKVDRISDIRRAYGKSVFQTIIEVTVPGNTNLDIGKVIELEFPLTSTDHNEGDVDKYLTGKYLITKLRHTIQFTHTDSFSTILECTKDGSIT